MSNISTNPLFLTLLGLAHLPACAATAWDALNVRLGAAFAWHGIDATRTIAFPGLFDVARASYNGQIGQVFGQVGLAMNLGNMAFEPFARIGWVHIVTGGFANADPSGSQLRFIRASDGARPP